MFHFHLHVVPRYVDKAKDRLALPWQPGVCVDSEIHHLTTYVLSADNIRKRSAREVGILFGLLADTMPDLVRRSESWSLHVAGDLAMLPADAREALEAAAGTPPDVPAT